MAPLSQGPSAIGVTLMFGVTAVIIAVAVVLSESDAGASSGTLASNVTVDGITEQRGRFIDERVVVTAEIDTIVAPRVLTLEGDAGNHLLVVTERPVEEVGGSGVSDGDRVTVSGTVRATDSAEVRRALEPAGGEPPVFHDAPAILAEQVVITPRDGAAE